MKEIITGSLLIKFISTVPKVLFFKTTDLHNVIQTTKASTYDKK